MWYVWCVWVGVVMLLILFHSIYKEDEVGGVREVGVINYKLP